MKLPGSRRQLTAALVLLVGWTCACARAGPARRAFFFWRTVFALSESERSALREHHISRLYVRFFDVVAQGSPARPEPVGRIAFQEAPPAGTEVVPVVFLKNQTFAVGTDTTDLASKVWSLTSSTARGAGIRFDEVQVDCDWTAGTRAPFFAFCATLGEHARLAGVRLSATIRLHQVKYRQRTGVPPVARGTLMFYNLGTIAAEDGPSSIFNEEDAARYTGSIGGYPLPLDVALPIFSWLVHARDGRVIGLIEKTGEATLAGSALLRQQSPGRWLAVAPGYLHGTYLKAGDTLRREAVPPTLARRAAAMLRGHVSPAPGFTVALFDLDARNLAAFSGPDLEALFSTLP